MKTCKYCRMEIDSKAKICPHCRKKQKSGIGIFLTWTFIGLFSLTALVVWVYYQSTDSGSSSSSSSYSSSSSTKKQRTTFDKYAADKSKDEIKEMCSKEADYKDFLRNSSSHFGSFIHYKGKVSQKIKNNGDPFFRITSVNWMDDEEFVMFDMRSTQVPTMIEGDIVEIWGMYKGTVEVERALTGNAVDVPSVDIFLVEICEEEEE